VNARLLAVDLGVIGCEPLAVNARLLAVDLGLRMGLALFNGEGRLLQYAYRRVENAVELGDLAEGVLSGQSLIWQPGELDRARDLAEGARDLAGGGLVPNMAPESAGAAPDTARSQSTAIPVTHVAIEGRDLDLRREWEAAAARVAARRGGGGGGGGGGGPAARVMEVSLIVTDCDRLRRIATDCDRLRLITYDCVGLRRIATDYVRLHLMRPNCVPHQVSPEAWRKELMLPKERRNGAQAKAAARLVARQV